MVERDPEGVKLSRAGGFFEKLDPYRRMIGKTISKGVVDDRGSR
jgi:hypothetical protein